MKKPAQLGKSPVAIVSWRRDLPTQREEGITFALPLRSDGLSNVSRLSRTHRTSRYPPFQGDLAQGNGGGGHCSLSPLRVVGYRARCQARCVPATAQPCLFLSPTSNSVSTQHSWESNRQGQKQYVTAFLSWKSSCF